MSQGEADIRSGKSGQHQRWRRSNLSGTFITQQILPDSAQINCSSFHIGFWLSDNSQQRSQIPPSKMLQNLSGGSFAAKISEKVLGGKYKWIWMAFHWRQTWINNEPYRGISSANVIIRNEFARLWGHAEPFYKKLKKAPKCFIFPDHCLCWPSNLCNYFPIWSFLNQYPIKRTSSSSPDRCVIEHLSETRRKHKLNVKNINIFGPEQAQIQRHHRTHIPSRNQNRLHCFPFLGTGPPPSCGGVLSHRNGGGPELPPEVAKRKGTTKPLNTSVAATPKRRRNGRRRAKRQQCENF